MSPTEEEGLVEPYKEGLISEWGIKKFNLDDLYVRFFRLAERRIAEMTGQGVICYISNFSYLSDPSFVVMRKRFLQEFDKVWIDCLNGDSRETGKLTPEGRPDPSVFSTEMNPAGIRVGTTVGLLLRRRPNQTPTEVRFREFWGATKRSDLVRSLQAADMSSAYTAVSPTVADRFRFTPSAVAAHYWAWPKVAELPELGPYNGPVERRGNSLVVFDDQAHALLQALAVYLDPERSDEEVATVCPLFMRSSGEFNATKARASLKGRVQCHPSSLSRYPFKPFDTRLAYLYHRLQPLFSRPSPELLWQRAEGNAFLLTRDTADKAPEGPPFFYSRLVCDYDCISGHARHFPFLVRDIEINRSRQGTLYSLGEGPRANLSQKARVWLTDIGFRANKIDADCAWATWLHVLAMGYSPAYLTENADGIQHDWPRVPLPNSRGLLNSSAAIGRELAALLDTENSVKGVTVGHIRAELRVVGVASRVGGGQLSLPAGELALTAGWGHRGKGGVTMPGKGKAEERAYTAEELAAIESGAAELGLSPERAVEHLGKKTFDVFLNGVAYWRNVPARVWGYTIGGYQVMKKWLSYRERDLLGRPLSLDEAHYVTEMARRLAALALLEPALEANYEGVKGNTYAWTRGEEGA